MVTLSLKGGGAPVGTISEEDFQFLVDQLEEESVSDTDYYLTSATIDLLEERGAGETLLAVLKRAVGDSDGVEVSWARP
jgi:hypothetical protein